MSVADISEVESAESAILVGDYVHVKLPAGAAPKYGWGSITAAMVGVVQAIEATGKITVDFPVQRGYESRSLCVGCG